jgi:hypothetical protein
MTISLSPRTGVSGILQDGVEVVTIGSTGITAGIPAATTAEIQALTITNKFVNPANAGALALGVGQTWQGVSRVIGTTYVNTTGKPIFLSIQANAAGSNSITVNGVIAGNATTAAGNAVPLFSIIPIGASYVIGGAAVLTYELR